MTDNEIIKAFDCCYTDRYPDCTECPRYNREKEGCMDVGSGNIYDLPKAIIGLSNRQQETINRLKAENKNCGAKIQNQREQLKACNEKIKEQQAEIERLNARCVNTQVGYNFAKADIEKEQKRISNLKHALFEQQSYTAKLQKELATAKSEAVKEFAERLLQKKYQSSDWSHGEHPFVVEENDILDTLEEMRCGE